MLEYRDVYAGGRLVGSGSADVITIVNPATEEVAGAVPSMVGTDVEVAVTAARKAFDAGPWPQLSPAERAAAMVRLAAWRINSTISLASRTAPTCPRGAR